MKERLDYFAKVCAVALFFVFPFSLALGNVLMVLTALFWLLSGDYRRKWTVLRKYPVVWAAIFLYGLVLIGATYSSASGTDIQGVVIKYSKLLIMVFLIALLHGSAWRERCLDAFVGGVLVALATVYLTVWWEVPWAVTKDKGWGGEHVAFGDRITQSIIMSFFVLIALTRAKATKSVGWRAWWCVISFLASLSMIHLSTGRTGYLLLTVALVVFSLSFDQIHKRFASLGLLLGALVLMGLTSQTLQERVEKGIHEAKTYDSMEVTSIGGRINFWRYSWELIEKRPWFGWGTGSYHDQWCVVTSNIPDWCTFGRWHPHNQFLHLWVENGIFSVVLFLILVCAPLMRARHESKYPQLLWGFSIILLTDSLINAPLWNSREAHFFLFMMAFLVTEPVPSSSENSSYDSTDAKAA